MKRIEKNGYPISEMMLGTVQLGLSYGINNQKGMPTYEESAAILQEALDLGICAFDTARAYGKSEEVLGRFFTATPAEKTIITKVIFPTESADEVASSLFSQVKDSTKTLGLDRLPFVMLHREDYLLTYGKVLTDALCELKKEGLVGGVGVSFSDKSNMERLLDNDVFDCIQIPQNIFDNKEMTSGMLSTLSARGIAVFIRSVYLQGLFFRNTDTLPPKLTVAKPVLDKLHALADENGLSMSQMALSYIRDGEGISSLVLGCETVEQLRDSAKQFASPALPPALREELTALANEVDPIVTRPWEWNK